EEAAIIGAQVERRINRSTRPPRLVRCVARPPLDAMPRRRVNARRNLPLTQTVPGIGLGPARWRGRKDGPIGIGHLSLRSAGRRTGPCRSRSRAAVSVSPTTLVERGGGRNSTRRKERRLGQRQRGRTNDLSRIPRRPEVRAAENLEGRPTWF